MKRGAWRAPSARPEQGPLPEGGSETYVYSFVFVRPGEPEGKGERLATWEMTPAEYTRHGGRVGVDVSVDAQRRAWARAVRRSHMEGSVIVVKYRGFRRSQWAVPAGVQ